ncbi:MAG: efflux RND transporter periplasmic adaptor subunit, partial [Aestuariivirgaceae bacterium]
QQGATLLTTIVSLDPIHFTFEASEADLLKYTRLSRNGGRPSSRGKATPVRVKLADEKDFVHLGQMDFVDNQIDTRSGTIRGRAIFANNDQLLQPGMFGRLQLLGRAAETLLIPDSAIASDQARRIVFTIGDDGVVTPKTVTLGPIVKGLRVVRSGIAETDRIVINGLQRARPGQKVTPEDGKIEAATGTGS